VPHTPIPGTQPCNKGEDPAAIKFVGCNKSQIALLRAKKNQIVAYIKSTYGDPPSAESDLCASLFSVTKCLDFVPPD
jgi:hypothetical protein